MASRKKKSHSAGYGDKGKEAAEGAIGGGSSPIGSCPRLNIEEAAMDEHERMVIAARQVDARIGFYIHFVVFILVCTGLAIVNWLATPEIRWVQWPVLGWGIGVLGHALCALGSGPNFMSRWRFRKIRELTHPATRGSETSGGASAAKTIGILLVGALIGCAAGGGYTYTVLADARANALTLEASRDALEKSFKEQEARLKQLSAEKSALEGTIKETIDRLSQLESSKQSAEQALQKAKDELADAQSAREAAERALAEAKKGSQ